MDYSFDVEELLDEKLKDYDLSRLRNFSEDLTQNYRSGTKKNYMSEEGHRIAYLCCRFPATASVIARVLFELQKREGLVQIESLLDVGAGPGTASHVVRKIFGALGRFTLLEKDKALGALGKEILNLKEDNFYWDFIDLEKKFTEDLHDLVIFSYSLGELSSQRQEILLKEAWKICKKYLIIVEPGTTLGFARIKKFRECLLKENAHLIAPCPGSYTCPIKEGDWCHFSARVARTSLHRQIKSGSLGHEDEKFSYLIFSKEKSNSPQARIVRHPLKRSGHVIFRVCKDGEIKDLVVTKKTDNYPIIKKSEWGDSIL